MVTAPSNYDPHPRRTLTPDEGQFGGDRCPRLIGRNDARSTACRGIRGTRATRSHQAESDVETRVRYLTPQRTVSQFLSQSLSSMGVR
jgi:hypothetical protein